MIFSSKLNMLGKVETLSMVENLFQFELVCILSSIIEFKKHFFEDFINSVRNNDGCTFIFAIDEGEKFVISRQSTISDYEDVQRKLSYHEPGEIIELKVRIEKEVVQNDFYFYSVECFYDFLVSYDPLSLAEYISSDQFEDTQIRICIADITTELKNDKFSITSTIQASTSYNLGLRHDRLSKIKSNTHSAHFGKLNVLPEDFIFDPSTINSLDLKVLTLFRQLSLILSVSAIFDITDLNSNNLFYKLNGYRSISDSIAIENLELNSLGAYFDIYEWIYTSGGVVDKIGLARNIISLHLKKIDSLELEGNVLDALKSSYKIYEKQNIKQYIEVRNKMTDQLLDYTKRAAGIIDSFAVGFQRSALSLVTFFSSIIVSKILATPKNNNDFVLYSAIITGVFICVTLIYMLISRDELKQQLNRFINSYNDFKMRYLDLLTQGDIDRILNNDKDHNADVSFINRKLKSYTKLWIYVLGLVAFSTLVYSYLSYQHYGQAINTSLFKNSIQVDF